jgi:tetratricopeptide (TPR) repeat protein
MADRLLVDLGTDGLVTVGTWPEGGLPETVSRERLEWPLDEGALEDLRWYLEDYLRAPFGVWEDRGPQIQARLAGWGEEIFASVFGSGRARDAYQRARDRELELVFRSASPALLGLPWELMRDPGGPVALGLAGVTRALPVADLAATAVVPGGRLRVLMVISRPAGTGDIGYQMIARPLLERLDAVRGQVELVVLRPPTLDALHEALAQAAAAGKPFHVVHFDGHGALPDRPTGSAEPGRQPGMMTNLAAEGVLAFERPGGGSDQVAASKVAAVLTGAGVPVVVLNACQSGAVGKDVEAAVATRLVREGCAAVVAMAYSVYAVAAAEFMAIFYECLFAGDTVSAAVTAGRRRLFAADLRPSPKGDLPLADWLVPVHYLRRDVSFPQAITPRPAGELSLDAALDRLREPAAGEQSGGGSLDPVGSFVGRDALFFELETAARLQKVVVLDGPGGTGKTELAKAFGRWWRDTGGVANPDFVFWHSFEPGVASFGLDGVIIEIGLQVFGSDFTALGTAKRRRVIQNLLAEHRLLLIWDNFETVQSMPDPAGATPPLGPAGCQELKEFLDHVASRGRSAVIITSRTSEDWLGGIRHITVGGLASYEAAEYAGELLAPYPAAQPRRARRTFGELMEWLDGHPLSMRLILPHLDTTDPEILLEGLRGTAPLPSGNGTEGGRITSLAASISYSYSHLAASTRRLLAAVSLFQGVADTNALMLFSQAIGVPGRFAGTSQEEWGKALDDAARVGLLTPLGNVIYAIHPALPAYLAAQWRSDEPEGHAAVREAATQALLTAYAGLGDWLNQQIRSGRAGLVFTIINWQRRTLGSLLGYALDHHRWKEAQDIAQPLNDYWDARGLFEEADAWTDRVRRATENPDGTAPWLETPAGRLWLFFTGRQANRQVDNHHLDQAERTYQEILASFQAQPASSEQQHFLAGAYHQLSEVAQQRGRPDDAESWSTKALAIREELGDRRRLAGTYHQLGTIAQQRGRLDNAENWYTKSLGIKEELGDLSGMASTYHAFGNVADLRGRLDDAEEWYTKALAIKEELGDRPSMARTYHQLGTIAQRRGRLDNAENWYTKALAIEEELGHRPLMARTYLQLGMAAQDRGRLDDAEEWYHKALAIEEKLGPPHVALTYHQLGIVAQQRGRLDNAENWYTKSLGISEELGDRPTMAFTYHQLSLLSEQRGQLSQALQWTVRSEGLFAEFPQLATGRGPEQLARLTAQLGISTLETYWRAITGNALPQAVRDYVESSAHPGGA